MKWDNKRQNNFNILNTAFLFFFFFFFKKRKTPGDTIIS